MNAQFADIQTKEQAAAVLDKWGVSTERKAAIMEELPAQIEAARAAGRSMLLMRDNRHGIRAVTKF